MTVRSTHLKLIGAAGAAALAVGALASPALAAGTASVNYTCNTPLGPAHPSAAYTVANAPAKMAVGQPLSTTAVFTLDPTTTALATGTLGWSKFKGTITTKPTASKAGLSLTFPKTTLGNGAGGSTTANAKGSTLAGSAVKSLFTFALGNLGKVSLTGYDASGAKVGTVDFPNSDGTFAQCTNDAGSTLLKNGATPVTTKVVKDTTKTKESASYAAKKKSAASKAKVTSRYGTAATGKVTFTLKKGTHKVKTLSDKVNKKGIAKVVFKGVKAKGKYSITAKYAGSKSLKGSSGKDTFTVK
jgi:hypothetical protein